MKSTTLIIMGFVALLISLLLATVDQPQERSTRPYYAAQHFHAPFDVGLNDAAAKAAEEKQLRFDVSQDALRSCEGPGTACTPSVQSRR